MYDSISTHMLHVQVGALTEVLSPSAAAPVLLTSSKSWLGHAEPAAGIVGLLHAEYILGQRAGPPLASLRTLHPYVQRIMDGNSTSSWALPRQSCSFPCKTADLCAIAVGTSAFAFQGVCT